MFDIFIEAGLADGFYMFHFAFLRNIHLFFLLYYIFFSKAIINFTSLQDTIFMLLTCRYIRRQSSCITRCFVLSRILRKRRRYLFLPLLLLPALNNIPHSAPPTTAMNISAIAVPIPGRDLFNMQNKAVESKTSMPAAAAAANAGRIVPCFDAIRAHTAAPISFITVHKTDITPSEGCMFLISSAATSKRITTAAVPANAQSSSVNTDSICQCVHSFTSEYILI